LGVGDADDIAHRAGLAGPAAHGDRQPAGFVDQGDEIALGDDLLALDVAGAQGRPRHQRPAGHLVDRGARIADQIVRLAVARAALDQDIGLDATAGRYYLDGLAGKVSTVSHSGKVVKLTLAAASTAKAITYVQGTTWDGIQTTLLYGSNGIAALTFADVPLTPPTPSGLGATPGVSQVGLTWTAAAGATGYNVKRSSASGGPFAVIGTTAGTASYPDSTATNGITYYYVVSANNTAGESADSNQAGATPNTPYGAWAANPAQGLTAGVNDGPMDDPDHDGISNVLEFVLGGAPMVSSQTILPKLTRSGGSWFYEYDRSDLSQPPATTQEVEYGNNLSGWEPITIPLTGAGPVVTITPGSPADHVKVAIPEPGGNGFVRLKVTHPD
jgi:hypothetical protein